MSSIYISARRASWASRARGKMRRQEAIRLEHNSTAIAKVLDCRPNFSCLYGIDNKSVRSETGPLLAQGIAFRNPISSELNNEGGTNVRSKVLRFFICRCDFQR